MLLNYYKTKPLMRCRYLSLLVPLSSMVALLVVGIISFIPDTLIDNSLVYAVEDNHDSNNDGISLLADAPSASLSISTPNLTTTGKPGEVVNMSSNVSFTGTLINSYSLQISGNPVLEGSTTIDSITSDKPTLDDNEWGYKWNSSTNYKGISNTLSTIISSTTPTGSISSTNNTLTFSARFSNEAEAGHYKTSVNLLLTATPKTLVTYTLSYDGNGTTTNVPSSETVSNYNDSHTFTISNTKPTRAGYEFAGWSTSSTTTTAQYQPGESITLQASTPKALFMPCGNRKV